MREPNQKQGGSRIKSGMTAGRGNEDRNADEAAAPPWVRHFLEGLIVTGSVRSAVAESGIAFETAWALRKAEPEFAMYWDRALQAHRRIMAGIPFEEAVADEAASVH